MDQLPGQFTRTVFHQESHQTAPNTYSPTNNEVQIVLRNSLNKFSSSYNIPPTKNSVIIFRNKKADKIEYVFEGLGFGLVPPWAQPKDPAPVSKGAQQGVKYSRELQAHQAKYFNCRKETLAQGSPVWNSVKTQRCVVPIEGYFEWHKLKTDKTPYYVHSSEYQLIFLAGFYSHNSHYKDSFQDPESGYLSTFTVVTGPATKEDKQDLSWLHPRKPLMLLPGTKEWDHWLDPELKWSDTLLDTCLDTNNPAYDSITSYVVSKDVGNSANQGEYLVKEERKSPQKSIDSFFKPRARPGPGPDSSPKRPKHRP